MDETIALKQFETILHEENFDCSIATLSGKEKLLIFLGHDTSDREKICEITCDIQALPTKESMSYAKVQFLTLLPFSPKPHTINELNSCIQFLNGMLELPGFEYHEVENKILFRHIQFAEHAPDKTMLLSILGLILINLDMFSQTLEYVASGKATFYEILKDAVQISKNI